MMLQQLIAPLPPQDFLGQYWEKRELHVCRSSPEYFHLIRDCVDLRLLVEENLSWGEVSLAKAGTDPACVPYLLDHPTWGTVSAAFDDGYTIVINDVQSRRIQVAELCRSLERFFCFRCSANLYVTGPHCSGLDPHYDDQDVFILQLEGSKLWSLYDPEVQLPIEGAAYRIPATLSGKTQVLLNAGDVLYIPRGHVHEAAALADRSVHLTVSISVIRLAAVVKHFIDRMAEREPWLRQGLPPGCLKEIALPLAVPAERSGAAPKPPGLKDALALIQDAVLSTLSTWRNDVPTEKRVALTCDSIVAIASDQLVFRAVLADGRIALKHIGGECVLAPDFRVAADLVANGAPFSISQLPGDFTDQQKIAFVGVLMSQGVLDLVQ